MALVFNKPETVIDGNVMRIIARLYHLTAPDEIADTICQKASFTSKENAADYASAIMDLGAVVCTPKIRNACYARGRNIAGHAPLQIWNRYRFAADWRRKKNRVLFW